MAGDLTEEQLAKQKEDELAKQQQTPTLSDSNYGVSTQIKPQSQKFPDSTTQGLFIPIAANFSIKFDGTNYPLWRRQVFGLFRGLRLHGLLDGSITLSDSNDPENLRWCDQDALLQQGMIISFSPAVLSSISSAVTCRDIWVTLEQIYASASPTRLLNLTERFQQARKEPSQSVADFLHTLESLSDEIIKLGQPLSGPAFTLGIINGLQDEFPEICAILRLLKKDWRFEELYEAFVSCEEGRKRRDRLLGLPATANAAVTSGKPNLGSGSHHGGYAGRPNQSKPNNGPILLNLMVSPMESPNLLQFAKFVRKRATQPPLIGLVSNPKPIWRIPVLMKYYSILELRIMLPMT